MLRQGRLQGLHQSGCVHKLAMVKPRKCRARSVPAVTPARQHMVRPVPAAAADAPPAAEPKKRGRKPGRTKTAEEEKGEEDMPVELPTVSGLPCLLLVSAVQTTLSSEMSFDQRQELRDDKSFA